jgi:hypothetical protein
MRGKKGKATNLCVPSEEGAGEDHANNGLQEVCAPVVKGSPVPNGCSQNKFVLGFRIQDFGFRAFLVKKPAQKLTV